MSVLIFLHSYGNRGYHIIVESFGDLRTDIQEEVVAPLGAIDFFYYIVVPRVAFLLMREDRPELSEDDVWLMLRAAQTYG